ncbi:MAG: hypothetical protein JWL70_1459, partial [Acidimicrobiia bacterium]|nr:hypothetical protein [Acidimicrobiia bacterium]
MITVALVALIAALAIVRQSRSGSSPWAKSWDPRIDDLRKFVEQERGLPFKHPVKVVFLSDADFEAALKAENSSGKPTVEQQKNLEATLRAIGAIDGTLDLAKTSGDLNTNVVGYYSWLDKVVRVRGNELTPYVRTTLAHELTHAAQDQRYDLEKRDKAARRASSESAFRAVVEADAMQVEAAYKESKLSASEKAQADATGSAVSKQSTGNEAPAIYQLEQAMPYVLGPQFLDYLKAASISSVDDVFARPPSSDADLLNPARYIDKLTPTVVDRPNLGAGEQAVATGTDDDRVGAFDWYVVLSGRVDPVRALEAVAGWRGDRGVTFRKNGQLCTRTDVVFDTEGDAADFGRAATDWALKPAGAAHFEVNGTRVRATMCDPGEHAPGAVVDRADISWRMLLPSVQVQLQTAFRDKGISEARSRCATSFVLHAVPPEVWM